MALHPTNERLKERILVMGGPGAGKTYDFFKIADLAQKTESTSKFYVADTDNASDRALGTEFSHLTNVVDPYLSFDWDDLIDNLKKIREQVQPQDWTMIDMMGPTWDLVQEKFIQEVIGKDYTDFFMQARIATGGDQKAGNALDGWKDWSVINKMYRELTNMILRWPCHVYCTSGIATVNSDQDAKEIKAIFGRLGVKPKGQKDLAHHFHTVLWKMVNLKGWEMSTAKDRGREILAGESIDDFAVSYLIRRAGWRP